MSTAYVLSGGASLGAVQVGMLTALAEHGEQPDLIIGTSVGAVNGGWIASRGDIAGVAALAELWRSLRRQDVFPTRPLVGLRGFLGRQNHLVPNSHLRRLLEANLQFRRLEEAPIPLHLVATDVVTGQDVRLSSGDAVDAILASGAIPSVFPPVRIGGRDLMDGGVVNNTPISHAIALGADRVWVLATGYSCALEKPPQSALSMALHALTLVVNQRLAIDLARDESQIDLRVVPPLCPIRVSPADFSQSADLIDGAYRATREWLDAWRPTEGQAALLEPHDHAASARQVSRIPQ
jgi:NTE family protein